jgi:CRISPR system Cascade subunit CasD
VTTLLLRFASPLMSFGHSGRYDNRPSAATPSLSAVQGLVAAAAGFGRHARWPDWVADLHLAIRVERPGRMLTDYHTVNQPDLRLYRSLTAKKGRAADIDLVRNVADADGNRKDTTVVSRREWISDATFLVAIADPTGNVAAAIDRPVWHLYAGRKAAPMAAPFRLGRHDDSPASLLATIATVRAPHDPVGERIARSRVLFTDPGTDSVHVEDRPDRSAGFRRHSTQRRWHDTVQVPVAADWFDLIPTSTAVPT